MEWNWHLKLYRPPRVRDVIRCFTEIEFSPYHCMLLCTLTQFWAKSERKRFCNGPWMISEQFCIAFVASNDV